MTILLVIGYLVIWVIVAKISVWFIVGVVESNSRINDIKGNAFMIGMFWFITVPVAIIIVIAGLLVWSSMEIGKRIL